MTIISFTSGSHCGDTDFLDQLIRRTGFTLVRQRDIVRDAGRLSGLSVQKVESAFSSKVSLFNTFTHEKEKALASVKLSLAELLVKDDLIIAGLVSMLIPSIISHVLRICLITDLPFRVAEAVRTENLVEKEAAKVIARRDSEQALFLKSINGETDPWNPRLFDIVIPADKMNPQQAADLVMKNLGKQILMPTEVSRQAVMNFLLAARVDVALAAQGHSVTVEVTRGAVNLTINKNVVMLSRLEEELKTIVSSVDGVTSVTTKVGKGFHQSDIYRKFDFEQPSKVLLVDDEREFVQTLSERLQMRDMGSVVAFDGQSALDIVQGDEPEVMILDLKMPGIDGLEVLRRVKVSRPEIEVIILTGHGSEADREQCLNLGAFAYLQKPVDIDVLGETLRAANLKMRRNLRLKEDSEGAAD